MLDCCSSKAALLKVYTTCLLPKLIKLIGTEKANDLIRICHEVYCSCLCCGPSIRCLHCMFLVKVARNQKYMARAAGCTSPSHMVLALDQAFASYQSNIDIGVPFAAGGVSFSIPPSSFWCECKLAPIWFRIVFWYPASFNH